MVQPPGDLGVLNGGAAVTALGGGTGDEFGPVHPPTVAGIEDRSDGRNVRPMVVPWDRSGTADGRFVTVVDGR